jgi:hypothetical protein
MIPHKLSLLMFKQIRLSIIKIATYGFLRNNNVTIKFQARLVKYIQKLQEALINVHKIKFVLLSNVLSQKIIKRKLHE